MAGHTPVPLDCHLMIDEPERWAAPYAEAGARTSPSTPKPSAPLRTARDLHAAGSRAGIAFNPGTAVEPYAELFSEFDMALIMTIEPGLRRPAVSAPTCCRPSPPFAGSCRERELDLWIQVDGGVTEDTAVQCVEAGANVLVAGSSVFGADDPGRGGAAHPRRGRRA